MGAGLFVGVGLWMGYGLVAGVGRRTAARPLHSAGRLAGCSQLLLTGEFSHDFMYLAQEAARSQKLNFLRYGAHAT